MARTLVFMVPVIVLSLWGFLYLRACFQLLASPGAGVDFQYRARGGVLRITADDYNFRIRRGQLYVARPRLRDADGRLLAAADNAQIEGLAFFGTQPPIHATLRNLTARLVRLQSGEFEVERYLPERTPETEDRAFRVTVNGAELFYDDFSGAAPFRQRLLSDRLNFEGKGDDFVAWAPLSLPDMGTATAVLRRFGGQGLMLDLDANRLDLSTAYRHFRTTPEGKKVALLQEIEAQRLVATGPLHLLVPPSGPADVSAKVDLSAAGVVYAKRDRFDSGRFQGLMTAAGAKGLLEVARAGAYAVINGSTSWEDGMELGGRIQARVPSAGSLPPILTSLIPRNVRFGQATAEGWLSYTKKTGWRYAGDARAARFEIGEFSLGQVQTNLTATQQAVRLADSSALWNGLMIEGDLGIDPGKRTLSGLLSLNEEALARSLRERGLELEILESNTEGLISGSFDEPRIRLSSEGTLRMNREGLAKPLVASFSASGRLTDKGLELRSGSLQSGEGSAIFAGSVAPGGNLDIRVAARSMPLGLLNESMSGDVGFTGTVRGSMSAPMLIGTAQVAGAKLWDYDVAFATGSVVATAERISFTEVRAVQGSARLNGSGSVALASGALAGAFEGRSIPLGELSDQLAGTVNLFDGRLTGTLARPIVTGSVESNGFVVAGRAIESARAKVAIDGTNFRFPEIRAAIAGGEIIASATGSFEPLAARVELSAKDVRIDEVLPELAQSADVEGRVGGLAVMSYRGGKVHDARASGSLESVEINNILVGGGPWTLVLDERSVSGSLQVGTLDRYLELSRFELDRVAETIEADLIAYRIPIEEASLALARYLPEPANELDRKLREIDGVLDANVAVRGQVRDPSVNLSLLEVGDLVLENRNLGKLAASMSFQSNRWSVGNLSLIGEAGTITGSGTFEEGGQAAFEGEIANFDLSLLAMADDRLARLRGRAGASFVVSGPADSPTIDASLDARKTSFVVASNEDDQTVVDFGLVLDTIKISESRTGEGGSPTGGISTTGRLFYRGFEGNLAANIPLRYPFELPNGEPLSATLALSPTELLSMSEFTPMLDKTRTSGTVSGRIALGGRVGSATLDGHVELNAPVLALKDLKSALTEVKGALNLSGSTVSVEFAANSSEGGSVAAKASTELGDVTERLGELTTRGIDALLDRPVAGSAELDNFAIRFANSGKQAALDRLEADASGRLTLNGPMRSPRIEGGVAIANGELRMEGWEVAAGGQWSSLIEPQFGINLALSEPANLDTGIAKIRVNGGGTLDGGLKSPRVIADLGVEGGTLSLPTARIRIRPDGTMRLRYSVDDAGQALARLDVELEGETHLTTIDASELPEHYAIEITVRGNLLETGETLITAVSDPPGLSQDRILALLGQADLVAGILGGLSKIDTERRLRNTLAGYAIPVLFEPITGAFARELGLEYLNLEYSPYGTVAASFAKSLAPGLIFFARKQLSPPLSGFEQEYDLRLAYRLPFKGSEARRFSVSVGADEERTWKVALEYGFRF